MSIEQSGNDKNKISFKVCEKEYDSSELSAMLAWFKRNGWSSQETSWGVGGSQEVSTYKISKGSHSATLTFETYEGVILSTKPESAALFNEIRIRT